MHRHFATQILHPCVQVLYVCNLYLDSRQYEMIITNMDIKIIIKLIEVNKWRTTHKCFSSQACSGLDCRRNQSSIA